MPRTSESLDTDLAVLIANEDSATNDAVATIVDDAIAAIP